MVAASATSRRSAVSAVMTVAKIPAHALAESADVSKAHGFCRSAPTTTRPPRTPSIWVPGVCCSSVMGPANSAARLSNDVQVGLVPDERLARHVDQVLHDGRERHADRSSCHFLHLGQEVRVAEGLDSDFPNVAQHLVGRDTGTVARHDDVLDVEVVGIRLFVAHGATVSSRSPSHPDADRASSAHAAARPSAHAAARPSAHAAVGPVPDHAARGRGSADLPMREEGPALTSRPCQTMRRGRLFDRMGNDVSVEE
jgi:hypothetical protein